MAAATALALFALVTQACAAPPPQDFNGVLKGILASGTVAEAKMALPFRVRQPAYLPAGAKQVGVEWSTQMGEPFVVQRYAMPDGQGFYVMAIRPNEESEGPPIDNELLIQGRMATLTAASQDGRLLEWQLLWRIGAVHHLVAGDIPAEEIVLVAASLR